MIVKYDGNVMKYHGNVIEMSWKSKKIAISGNPGNSLQKYDIADYEKVARMAAWEKKQLQGSDFTFVNQL